MAIDHVLCNKKISTWFLHHSASFVVIRNEAAVARYSCFVVHAMFLLRFSSTALSLFNAEKISEFFHLSFSVTMLNPLTGC